LPLFSPQSVSAKKNGERKIKKGVWLFFLLLSIPKWEKRRVPERGFTSSFYFFWGYPQKFNFLLFEKNCSLFAHLSKRFVPKWTHSHNLKEEMGKLPLLFSGVSPLFTQTGFPKEKELGNSPRFWRSFEGVSFLTQKIPLFQFFRIKNE